jgi:hypothetical protein
LVEELDKFRRAFEKLELVACQDQSSTKPLDWARLQDLPPLEDLARPLDKILFGGLLAYVDYQWVTHTHDGREAARKFLGRTCVLRGVTHVGLVPMTIWNSNRIGYRTPQERSYSMIGILLHEQIHALFRTYLCKGHCAGTPEQQRLCTYLSWRLVQLNGSPESRCHCPGHGPAFHEIARQLQRVAPGILGTKEFSLGDFVKACNCSETPMCLAHCYDPYYDRVSYAKDKHPRFRSLEHYFFGYKKCRGPPEPTTPALPWPTPALAPSPTPESISWKVWVYAAVVTEILSIYWKFERYLDRFNSY